MKFVKVQRANYSLDVAIPTTKFEREMLQKLK